MRDSVTSAINDVHCNTVSTYGDPRIHRNYGNPLVPAIHLSAAYSFDSPEALVECHEDKYRGVRYARDVSAGTLQLEAYFAAMFPGCHALVFDSGMSAMAAPLDLLARPGGTVYVSTETYRKTHAYLNRQAALLGMEIARFHEVKELEERIVDGAKAVVVLESPTNPHLLVHDYEALAVLKERTGCAVIADISLAGLCNIRFDFSRYDYTTLSCTKYISGHNDLIGGVLLAGNEDLHRRAWELRSERGGIMDPHTAYLMLRSLRTYDMRVERQAANALKIIEHLEKKPGITSLCHPACSFGVQARLFHRYYRHGGSMISFVVEMDRNVVLSRLAQMHSIKMAPSFGAVDTLVEVPAVMSHYGKSDRELQEIGLEPDLVRLSVGCEPADDLIHDLDYLLAGERR